MEFFYIKIIELSLSILPWILIGSVVDYAFGRIIHFKSLVTYLKDPTPRKIFLVEIFGMFSPFTTMSFLPIANKLAKRGAHVGLLLGFLGAERAYGIQSFFILSALFGVKIAFFHLVVLVLSLFIASLLTQKTSSAKEDIEESLVKDPDGIKMFMHRQARIYLFVFIGVVLAAGLDAFVPASFANVFSKNEAFSVVGAIILSFVVYLGTIFGNYPVAASFLDLGMPMISVFLFLVLSPLFNAVIIFLLASSIRIRYVIRFVALYGIAGFALSLLAVTLFF